MSNLFSQSSGVPTSGLINNGQGRNLFFGLLTAEPYIDLTELPTTLDPALTSLVSNGLDFCGETEVSTLGVDVMAGLVVACDGSFPPSTELPVLAALLLMKESTAKERGLNVLGYIKQYSLPRRNHH